jgi:hypothetical protein
MTTLANKLYLRHIILLFTLLTISCSSFNSKENFLTDFTAFIANVEKNYISYTSADWELKDAEFKQYTEDKLEEHRDTFTKEDKKAIGKLVGRYSVVRAKGYGKQFKDGLNDTKDFLKGFLEGLTDYNADSNKNNNQQIQ